MKFPFQIVQMYVLVITSCKELGQILISVYVIDLALTTYTGCYKWLHEEC